MDATLIGLAVFLALLLAVSILGRRQGDRVGVDPSRRTFLKTVVTGAVVAVGAGVGLVGWSQPLPPSWIQAGYVYFPYIPLFSMPQFIDPSGVVVKRGVMQRYSKKNVNPDYYCRVTFTDDDPEVVDQMARDFDEELESRWGVLVDEGDTSEKRAMVETLLDNQLAEMKRRSNDKDV